MLLLLLLPLVTLSSTSSALCIRPTFFSPTTRHCHCPTQRQLSDWSDFSLLEDDDDLLSSPDRTIAYANENDPQEYKARVGMQVAEPEICDDYDPIFVPQGSQLPLTEETIQGVLAACREEIGTMFGYTAENRGVGITGGVDFVDLDGPIVVLRLKGRFWHQRPTVLARVGAYIQGRIPEVMDVVIDDPYQLTDEANNSAL